MKNCNKCKQAIQNGDEKKLHEETLCEDCYIDAVMPKMPKAHYDNDAEFMQWRNRPLQTFLFVAFSS